MAEEKEALGEAYFAQEYHNRFIEPSGSVFRYEDIEAMLDNDLQPLFLGGEQTQTEENE